MLLVTQEYDFDLCSFFRRGRSDPYLLWPVTDVFQGWSAVGLCEGELIVLQEAEFRVVISAVRPLRKFDCTFFVDCRPNKYRPMANDRDLRFW